MDFINKIINTDCSEGLKMLPDKSVDCCVTSPPYYGLRDYGCSGQIGLEETPELYIARLVELFTDVYRVLKPTGTLWINIGDSYAGGQGRWGGIEKISKLQSANQGSISQIQVAKKWKHEYIKPKDIYLKGFLKQRFC